MTPRPSPRLEATLRAATHRLNTKGIESASVDARLLLAHVLNLTRADLIAQSARTLTPFESESFEALLQRREAYEPVARILGEREFSGLPFALNEATLDPRPDSETLVEEVLKRLKTAGYFGTAHDDRFLNPALSTVIPAKAGVTGRRCDDTRESMPCRRRGSSPPRILDLGTGSGCLLLAILHAWSEAIGLGVDIAPRAVAQARQNARALELSKRARFRVGTWGEGLKKPFDLVISNPPYIPTSVIPGLMPDVRLYDPLAALDGGPDGLDAYRALLPDVRRLLKPGGFVMLEVGEGQAQAVESLLAAAGFLHTFRAQDLAGIERCVGGERGPSGTGSSLSSSRRRPGPQDVGQSCQESLGTPAFAGVTTLS